MEDLFSIHGNHLRPDKGHRAIESRGIDRLPHDLLIEVLSRLPTKVLCRCRCVSKSWLSLLSCNTEFMSRHEEWSKKQPLMLVRRYLSSGIGNKITIELTTIDMEGDVTDKFKKVIDGLVHSFISCGPLTALCCMYSLYICNPSIRQLVRVPSRPNSRFYNIGLGYLPASDEYKVVHMSSSVDGKMGYEIFSFRASQGVKSGQWKTIGECPYSAWTDEYPVCINGTMYWGLSSGWKERSILSLDLDTQEFDRVSYPSHDSTKHTLLGYAGLMGALSVVGFCADMTTIDVWMMKDKRSKEWGMEYSIKVFPWCPKFLVPSNDESEEIMVHMDQKDLISYSLRDQSSRKTGFYRAMKTYNKPCVYYGSLAAVGSGA